MIAFLSNVLALLTVIALCVGICNFVVYGRILGGPGKKGRHE